MATVSTNTTMSRPGYVDPNGTEAKHEVGEYPLARDYIDFTRLNLQHHLWKDIFGYSLSPKIPRDKEFLKVADVGTGTGVWLLDLHSQLDPSIKTELVGLDVDIGQVGPKEWLPENLSLRQWSVFDEPPADLAGTFDIVNVRLIVFVIDQDPVPVLRNLMKLLKPGGHLQWCEIDLESQHVETIAPGIATDCLEAVQKMTVVENTPLLPTWVRRLAQTLRDEGLEAVTADWQSGRRHTMLSMHWCNLTIPINISDKIRQTNPEKAAHIDAMIEGAIAESQKGAMWAHNRLIVTARKPLA
ncbi:S-adenosyl-L-methionine-dependent methyltransferase [Apiospora kogelbergensis]|uniref:S-adenosyl-L-methionine-dependent methyltransferase n=1 Tax=Apiospora kogelbergensis TaxID=1337665 RepID=A0AAW0QPC9_9PEZI